MSTPKRRAIASLVTLVYLLTLLACQLGGAEKPTPDSKAIAIPTTAEATPVPPTTVAPSPAGTEVTLPDGHQIPLPADAEVVPVVQGFYIGFATSLTEPQLFDFYTTWLQQAGWQQQAPTEAMITPPHQRWRKNDSELLIELQPPDEQGRTVAWIRVTSLAAHGPWTNYTNGNEILALAASEGTLWAGTRGGAVRWNTANGSATQYTRDDGLADNTVQAIAVNQGGTAWFLTAGGVSRYDGVQWVTYPSLEEAIEADYAAILSTVSGHGLWVVQPPDKVWLTSGPVRVYDGQQWTTYTTADGLPEDSHRATAVGPDGRVWVGTWYRGLSVFDGQAWTTYNYGNTGYRGPTSDVGLTGDAITAVAVDAAGTVWVGAEMDRMAQYGGLSRFDGREWVAYPGLSSVGTGPQHPAIHTIVTDGTGGVWLDTRHGLSYFTSTGTGDGENWVHFAEEQGLPSRQVNALVVDAAGQVWAGTDRGLARFDGTGWQAFLTDDGLASNEVRAVAADRAGRVWFGTSRGLSVFDGARWHTYTQADGLAADAISALAVDGTGRIWAGTGWWTAGGYVPEPAGAGVSVFDGTSWHTHSRADGLASDVVTAIAVDGAGRVWVGGEQIGPAGGRGISVFDGADWRVYTTDDGLAHDSVSALTVDGAGNVWIGANSPFYGGGQGVSVFDGAGFRHHGVEDGLASNEVTAIADDGTGNVWLGTSDSGVSHWDGQAWTRYTAADGLASDHITAIAADEAGNVWVGTANSGVSVFDGASFRTFTTGDGLVDNRIQAIAVGGGGSLWVATAGGASQLRPALLPMAPVATDTPHPTPSPTATPSPPTSVPQPTPTMPVAPRPSPIESFPVTGRYAEVWARLGGAEGRLGYPLRPAIEGTFAEQHFERGLMHWGRQDEVGNREVHVIVYGEGSNAQAGDLWGRFEDYWQEGDAEHSCPEATPPLGPRRGFGLVWCKYVRDSVGAPLEEERGIQASYQDFQGGVMIWSPTNGGLYVLFNQGDWRFETIE